MKAPGLILQVNQFSNSPPHSKEGWVDMFWIGLMLDCLVLVNIYVASEKNSLFKLFCESDDLMTLPSYGRWKNHKPDSPLILLRRWRRPEIFFPWPGCCILLMCTVSVKKQSLNDETRNQEISYFPNPCKYLILTPSLAQCHP